MRGLMLGVASSFAGCGSLGGTLSTDEPSKFYIGTRNDIYAITHPYEDSVVGPLVIPIVAVDLPLSVVMDTVLLPYTVPHDLLQDDATERAAAPK